MTRGHLPAWVRRKRRDVVQSILEALSAAMTAGDDDGIRAVLHPEVELVVDDGGTVPSSSPDVAPGSDGRNAAVVRLRALLASDIAITMASVNSSPGLLLVREGEGRDEVVGVVTAHMRDRLLANVWVVCNPDKLRHWNR